MKRIFLFPASWFTLLALFAIGCAHQPISKESLGTIGAVAWSDLPDQEKETNTSSDEETTSKIRGEQ